MIFMCALNRLSFILPIDLRFLLFCPLPLPLSYIHICRLSAYNHLQRMYKKIRNDNINEIERVNKNVIDKFSS